MTTAPQTPPQNTPHPTATKKPPERTIGPPRKPFIYKRKRPKRTGWDAARRRRQAEAIRGWQPWAHSTGPKTEAGKARSARNARRVRSPEAARELAIGNRYIRVSKHYCWYMEGKRPFTNYAALLKELDEATEAILRLLTNTLPPIGQTPPAAQPPSLGRETLIASILHKQGKPLPQAAALFYFGRRCGLMGRLC